MYSLEQLKTNRDIWNDLDIIPIQCSFCQIEFEVKYGTLYNVIRRDSPGIYCSRNCAGQAKAKATQNKYLEAGGKLCKRCEEFKDLSCFSILPNPPYLRAECKRCHNYKPARQYSLAKDKAHRAGIIFDLSMDQFLQQFSKSCFYCADELKTIRLEMLDLKNGYILGNIISCCRDCQKFKNDLEHEEFVSMCHKISDNFEREDS